MSNRTDAGIKSVHGTNLQFLLSQLTRNRIYGSEYWKEHCFGLDAESILEKIVGLRYIGGVYGGNYKATPFICLLLKLLQIGPSDAVVDEYLNESSFKYLQALACLYVRMLAQAKRVYERLEEFYGDNRLLRFRKQDGSFAVIHFDEFVDELLTQPVVIGIDLPPLAKRPILEQNVADPLPPRESVMRKEFEQRVKDNNLDDISIPSSITQACVWISR